MKMDKGNSGSRYRGFRPHSLRMQTSNRRTAPLVNNTLWINEYLPALPVELNLRGGNLESAVRLMHGRIGRLVGGTIGNNHPVINGALKLSASVIMMAGLAGMISGCGNVNDLSDENNDESGHESNHERGYENSSKQLEHTENTKISKVSSLDGCLEGMDQTITDSRIESLVSSNNCAAHEKAAHKKELCTYLHKHFNLDNIDENLDGSNNYLELIKLIKYAHENLDLKKVDRSDLNNFSKLARYNGLSLLKYVHENLELDYVSSRTLKHLTILVENDGLKLLKDAHENLGLKRVNFYNLKCMSSLAEEWELVRLLRTKGKGLFDYAGKPLGLSEVYPNDLRYLAKLAGSEGLNFLRNAHENFGLKRVRSGELESLVYLTKNNDLMSALKKDGKKLSSYVQKHVDLSKGNVYGLWGLAKLAKDNGLKLLKHIHQYFDLSDANDHDLYNLSRLAKNDPITKLKNLREQHGIDKTNSFHDLVKLLEHAGSFNEKKTYLYKQHGITHFERYSPKVIKLLHKESTNFKKDNRNVVLYVMNKNDTEGAFDNISKQIIALQKNYRIAVYEVDDDCGAIRSIEKTSKRIERPLGKGDFVFLGGHGAVCCLNLGYSPKEELDITEEHLYIDITDKKQLKGLGKYVSKGSTIILNSCSTGAGKARAGNFNLANFMASCLPGSTVYAPVSSTPAVNVQVDKSGRIKNISFPDAETYKVTK